MADLVNSPVVYSMRTVGWEVFGTFTYRNPLPSLYKRASLLHCLLDRVCRETHTHFDRHYSLTRYETGEVGGRDHNHVLFANLKPGVHTTELCLRLKAYWDRIGGFARVWPYISTMDGVEYVLKGSERYEFMGEAQSYEATKFGIGDKVTMSKALATRMASRRCGRHTLTNHTPQHGETDRSGHVPEHGAADSDRFAAIARGSDAASAGGRIEIDSTESRWLCKPMYT